MTKNLAWKATKNRWQKTMKTFSARFGTAPVLVTVFGIEGEESAPLQ